jgi:hypothetical protein
MFRYAQFTPDWGYILTIFSLYFSEIFYIEGFRLFCAVRKKGKILPPLFVFLSQYAEFTPPFL